MKNGKLTVELGANLKKAFIEHCKENGYNPSAVIRMLLVKELKLRGVEIKEEED